MSKRDWLPDVDEKRLGMMNMLMQELCNQMVRYLERKFCLQIVNSGYSLVEKGDDFYDENLICFEFIWKNTLKVSYYYNFPSMYKKILVINYGENNRFLYHEHPNMNTFRDKESTIDIQIRAIMNYFIYDDDFIKVSYNKYDKLYNTSYYYNLQSVTTFLLICRNNPIFPKDIYLLISKKILFFFVLNRKNIFYHFT